ncbi:MAG TPA: hypothetical protein VGE16_04810 [Albitalea sp.]
MKKRTRLQREPFSHEQFLSFFNSHWINTMYRCAIAAVAACLIAPAAAQAQSQERQFPQNALRGALTLNTPSQATLNDRPVPLAPGLRIRGQNNMLQMSGALLGSKLLVNYTLDMQGAVKDVWVLTAQEAAKKPWPTTAAQAQAWSFDPVAQVWTKP